MSDPGSSSLSNSSGGKIPWTLYSSCFEDRANNLILHPPEDSSTLGVAKAFDLQGSIYLSAQDKAGTRDLKITNAHPSRATVGRRSPCALSRVDIGVSSSLLSWRASGRPACVRMAASSPRDWGCCPGSGQSDGEWFESLRSVRSGPLEKTTSVGVAAVKDWSGACHLMSA